MRVPLLCIAALAFAAAIPQSSPDLHTRYGKPDLERFAAGSDATITVEYGPSGHACKLFFEPRRAFIQTLSPGRPASIPMEKATKFLDEFAPPASRGKLLQGGGSFQSSCNVFEPSSYENVKTVLAINGCAKPLSVLRAQIEFNIAECANSIK